jgi:lipopolysaccharide/colanic/teichoic acid biosynthesis glycosyltransferase
MDLLFQQNTAVSVEKIVNARRSDNGSGWGALGVTGESAAERIVLNKQEFRRMISLERKRSERSQKPFLLMLLDFGASLPSPRSEKVLADILDALTRSVRETDTAGWYEDRSTFGIMFTEIGSDDHEVSVKALVSRITEALRTCLTLDQFDRISVAFHVFPDDWHPGDSQRPGSGATLYPDLTEREKSRKASHAIKRAMDIVGSSFALICLAPIFVIIAIAIKLTSKGPVFFRQARVGQYGVPFELLKFRSMRANSSSHAHKEYVQQMIAGTAEKQSSNCGEGTVYKLTKDSRITAVGAVLRRLSLDELPQFINVLKGEMSLVGPRPPIDYEVERYELWHRRRLIEAKPGITGLWQVAGRNRIAFDDMVRLDLNYAQTWSPWVDLKILLRTPKAVIEGAH